MNEKIKNLVIWSVIVILLISVFSSLNQRHLDSQKITYSQFLSALKKEEISRVNIAQQNVQGLMKNGRYFATYIPMEDPLLLGELIKNGVDVNGRPPQQQGLLMHIFINWFPMLLLIAVWIFFMRQMQGGRGGPMSFGRSRARMFNTDQIKVTFADVGGVDEAVSELMRIKDFLSDPKKFQKLGARIPKGVLLLGPPGTGKTLLAKAVAGEAGVPFFTISGSDFVEMFVGVGASRVRDLFEQAKAEAPCIIFIDEIDAVGRRRGAGLGGGHDEREQTLNQMLVEMDGFEGQEGVIVMAATNRPDVLDPALLRPGRFDQQVVVPLPDVSGRYKILTVHLRKVPADPDVDVKTLAQATPGFSGADLKNLVNEGALMAASDGKSTVTMHTLENAKDKIMMGAERRSMVMKEAEKRMTAYHESGHAIIGIALQNEGHDPVYKVTIIPRGRALGVTMFLPEEDRYSFTRLSLLAQICSAYGGRIAEDMIFGEGKVTTGASNDIEKATKLAKDYVTKFGLSEMGAICYDDGDEEVFIGRSVSKGQQRSDKTAEQIDAEIRRILDTCYARATTILSEHKAQMHLMADALMKYETIGKEQLEDVMAGRAARPPKNWVDIKNAGENDEENGLPPADTPTVQTVSDTPAAVSASTTSQDTPPDPVPPQTEKKKDDAENET